MIPLRQRPNEDRHKTPEKLLLALQRSKRLADPLNQVKSLEELLNNLKSTPIKNISSFVANGVFQVLGLESVFRQNYLNKKKDKKNFNSLKMGGASTFYAQQIMNLASKRFLEIPEAQIIRGNQGLLKQLALIQTISPWWFGVIYQPYVDQENEGVQPVKIQAKPCSNGLYSHVEKKGAFLRSLHLEYEDQPNTLVDQMFEKLIDLEFLEVYFHAPIHTNALKNILKLPKLKNIHLGLSPKTLKPEQFQLLVQSKKLKSVEFIKHTFKDDVFLNILSKSTFVESISFDMCCFYQGKAIEYIHKIPTLKQLYLYWNRNTTPEDMRLLKSIKTLKNISIEELPSENFPGEIVSELLLNSQLESAFFKLYQQNYPVINLKEKALKQFREQLIQKQKKEHEQKKAKTPREKNGFFAWFKKLWS